MFIRPVAVTVRSANRPPGHPLLRGLLARAAGAVTESPAEPQPRGLLGRAVRAAEDTGAVEWEPEGEREPEPESESEPWPPDPDAPEEPPPTTPTPPTGLVSELTQLAALTREGLLTPEEFTTAKARLLRG
ncbi:SHOCT domain-containing protein [Streptomyces sp. ISL-44]|uniref:SHOCT domain-containing protein n=1 Tax=Streptomyces sp. ISL-44 TaxID=2819184 RepID=UPI001BE80F93|nr:SHOCT domain-containing protein [Streptomyces sp. ISL-44]MBT2544071.1 SHOCT domain-containing protein [Streptomyces sp. ISL-44]